MFYYIKKYKLLHSNLRKTNANKYISVLKNLGKSGRTTRYKLHEGGDTLFKAKSLVSRQTVLGITGTHLLNY